MSEINIIIRTDGTFVNGATGDELTIGKVVELARVRRESDRATKKAQREVKALARKAERVRKLKAQQRKIEKQLKTLA